MKQLRTPALALPIPMVALSLAMLVAGACGSDDSTSPELSNAQLAGDWSLVSFQVLPQRALAPPATTGMLRLTGTRYNLLVVLGNAGAPDTIVADSGTYSVSGSSWTQVSDDPGVPSTTGSVTLLKSSGSEILEVNATTGSVKTHSLWSRPE